MLSLTGEPWLQFLTWVGAAAVMASLARLMKSANLVWGLVTAGVLLIGIRVGYKLLPFFESTPLLESSRYLIWIVGVVVLFVGIARYCNIALRPLFETR
jgi:hypothetical protein